MRVLALLFILALCADFAYLVITGGLFEPLLSSSPAFWALFLFVAILLVALVVRCVMFPKVPNVKPESLDARFWIAVYSFAGLVNFALTFSRVSGKEGWTGMAVLQLMFGIGFILIAILNYRQYKATRSVRN
jgi:lipoprotein signal peptidase